MDKLMVSLYIPVSGKEYDVLLPREISVAQATGLLREIFAGTTGGAYLPDESAVLCNREDGSAYNVNSSVEDLHLQNGSRLMLI